MSNSVEAPGSSPDGSDVPAATASDSAPPPQKAPPSPPGKNASPVPPAKESSPPPPTEESPSPPPQSNSSPTNESSPPPEESDAPPPEETSPPPPKPNPPQPKQSSPPPPQANAPPPKESAASPPESDSPPPSPPTASPPPPKSNSSTPPSLPKPANNPPPIPQTSPGSPPAPMLSPPPGSSPTIPSDTPSLPAPANSSPQPDAASPPPPAGVTVSPTSGGLQQPQQPPAVFSPPTTPLAPNMPNVPPNQATSSPGQVGRPTSRATPSGDSSSTSPDGKGGTDSGIPPGDANDASGHTAGKVVAAAAVVSVLLIMVIGVFLLARRRKRSKYNSTNNFSPKTDGVRYGQVPHSNGVSGTPNHLLGSQNSPRGDSYGSPQTGNTHPGGTPDSAVIGSSKIFFSYEELMELTSGFSRQNIIGEGGFGCVYKGCLQDGKMVAIKQLKLGGGQGDREFKAEVEIISRVHHRHLVSLVGYCISDNQRLLIYDFVPNKTLEHHLHTNGLPVLDWPKRLKIAIGSAKGLAYLHEDCYPKIIHRDIKSANILLDDDFDAQVADFGLARLNDTARSHVSTRVMGTFGYLAPEYASSGKLTDKSDVFSFGVVLLELISGRKPIDPTQPLGDESLVEWARPLLIEAIESGDLGELVDPRLGKNYVENEMFRMVETAAACVRHSASKRPRMVQVVRVLDSDNELSDLSNGVKFGKSIEYDSGQYSEDIRNFRRVALGSAAATSSEFETSSGEYASRDASQGLPVSGYTSGESETKAVSRPNHHNYGSDRLV